jgi:hypothetical protein
VSKNFSVAYGMRRRSAGNVPSSSTKFEEGDLPSAKEIVRSIMARNTPAHEETEFDADPDFLTSEMEASPFEGEEPVSAFDPSAEKRDRIARALASARIRTP